MEIAQAVCKLRYTALLNMGALYAGMPVRGKLSGWPAGYKELTFNWLGLVEFNLSGIFGSDNVQTRQRFHLLLCCAE